MDHKGTAGVTAEDTRDIEQLIRRNQTDMLFGRAASALLLLQIVGLIYVYVQWGHIEPKSLMLWYGALSLSSLIRALVVRGYQRDGNADQSVSNWLWRYRISVLFSAMTITCISVVFWNGEMDAYQAFTLSLLIGISAGALVTLHDFVALTFYVLLLQGPMALMSMLGENKLLVSSGLLELMLILIFLRFGATYNNTLRTSLRLRYENGFLLQDLKEEKSKLDNRLGRILNDSSNEIYVLNADTLQFLQINSRALDNLGYSCRELQVIRLPDILDGLDEAKVEQLLQPMRDGHKDYVFYRGKHHGKNGRKYPVEVRFQISREETPPIIVATALDITERNEYEQKLRYQANVDQLTGLPNRHYMTSHIEQGLVRSRRSGKRLALLFLDLDNFKSINDSLGHSAGDVLLQQAANRIRTVLREVDMAARLGGDEFLVMLEDLESPEHAGLVAEKLVNAFASLFPVDSRQVHSTTSIGISIYPGDGETVETLMQSADTAMYQAKRHGRSGYQFFSGEMREVAEEQMLIASHLSRALENKEISVVYQPVISIDGKTPRVVGAEALVRWHNAELGFVSPDKFISIAESLGMIQEIGQFVLNTACMEAANWPLAREGRRFISVNVSSRQFRNGDLLDCVDDALAYSNLPPEMLKLEITESLLIQDSQNPLEILNALRDRGIQLALDDFGTGYSSLSYLKKFPLQVLKIDRAFINDIGKDSSDEVLVAAIIAMSKSLGLDIVAEGVETWEQLDFLQQRGVVLIQGYYFSPPIAPGDFRELLHNESKPLALVAAS